MSAEWNCNIRMMDLDTAVQTHHTPLPWTKKSGSLPECHTSPAVGFSPGCLAPLWLQGVQRVGYQRMVTSPLRRCSHRGLWSGACVGGSSNLRVSLACLYTDPCWPPRDWCGCHSSAAPPTALSEMARCVHLVCHQKTQGSPHWSYMKWKYLTPQIHYDLTEAQLLSDHRWLPAVEGEGGRDGCWVMWWVDWGMTDVHQCEAGSNVLHWVRGGHRRTQTVAEWTHRMGPWPGRSEIWELAAQP